MKAVSLICIIAFPVLLSAQSKAASSTLHAELVFADEPEAVSVSGPDGKSVDVSIGMVLRAGYAVRCAESSVELQLIPNGSAIRLAPGTVFQIDALAGELGSRANAFSLISGKLRMAAAKLGTGENYTVRTASVVCGVRGTDFGRMYDPASAKDWVCVLEGVVDVSADGKTSVAVTAGSFMDLLSGFTPVPASSIWIANNFNDIYSFKRASLPENR
jgi:hypothetical protein